MIILLSFALVAGAGTAVTPCVLPVLPALLSASAAGGRRRPVGIAIGLVVTFTITIVGLATVVDGVGAGSGVLRTFAVLVLFFFGVSLLVPALGDRIEAPLSRLARFGPKHKGMGFWSGLGVGGALGFVMAPCAGPILAGVISVSASQGTSARLVGVGLAYAAGLGAVLLLYALGGRRVAERVRRAGRGPTLQRALGGVLVVTAVVMALSLDVRFQTALANHVPDALTNPTKSLERTGAVEDRLADLRGRSRFDSARAAAEPKPSAGTPAPVADSTPPLPVLGPAPDFTNTQREFNTGGSPVSLSRLRGRVVLIDFWTYTCINCIRTLPFVKGLDSQYRRVGLTVVGVHTPEFAFERDPGNVADAIAQNGLRYPVVQDNEYGTWNAYGNQYWPAKYLIDANGNVRYTHFGEGGEAQTEAAVRALLAEAGRTPGARTTARGEQPSTEVATPETYLGAARAERWLPVAPTPGTRAYPAHRGALPLSHFSLSGRWAVDDESAVAAGPGARIDAQVQAAKVFLVLSSRGDRPRRVTVKVDGRPLRTVTVTRQRLYPLVALPRVRQFSLELGLQAGVGGFAFTFG
ncbi:MAG: cytochrome c biogenesis protein DipZ [Solirubrobacteraceae bacterium]